MNHVKKLMMLAVLALTVFIVACSSETDGNSNDTGDQSNNSNSASSSNGDKIEIEFWHSMGGINLEVLEGIIDEYNNSQDEAVVIPIYQGSYFEGFSKLNSVLGTDEVPAIMQLNEASTKPMIDLEYIKPMQEFIDADSFDISSFEPAVLERYEVDGKLYSMPFNPSLAIVYYNKDAFREVGLDPDDPPHTYSEYKEAAEKLTIRSGDEVERYGMNIRNYGWHFEQLSVNQGGFVVNNENGRAGEPTETTINSEEMNRTFEWIKEMFDEGILANLGRSSDDANESFFAGNTAMYVHTSSVAVRTIDNADFEVGMATYPVPDGIEPHGSVIGGASVWIFDNIPDETQEAAWDFVRYLVDPETQAHWATSTGYFPVTQDAYETETFEQFFEDYPQVQAAYDQLHLSKGTHSNQGAFIGFYDDIWDNLANAYEMILLENMSVSEALDRANEAAQEGLEYYQMTQGN